MLQKYLKSFTCKATIITILLSLITPFVFMASAAAPNTGSVNISTNHINGLYTIHKKSDGSLVDQGDGIFSKQFILQADDYTVLFGGVAGTTTPSSFDFTLKTGDSLTYGPNESGVYITGVYVPVSGTSTGSVSINTNHINGSYEIRKTDDTYVDKGDGVLSKQFTIAAGTYKLVFGALTGYTTPTTVLFTLNSGDALTYGPNESGIYTAGVYVPVSGVSTGSVSISTNLVNGSYEIRKTDDTYVDKGDGLLSKQFTIAADTYKIVFGALTGYTTPTTKIFTLNAGDAFIYGPNESGIYTAGVYLPVGTGLADPALTSKTVDNLMPSAGDTVTYTVNYANLGTANATNVIIIDDYDENYLTVSNISDTNCVDDTTKITCTYPIAGAGGSGSITYDATISSATPPNTTVVNTATVLALASENSDPTNDIATALMIVGSTVPAGQLVITFKDDTGASFSGSGDVDIYRNGTIYSTGQSTDLSQTGMAPGKYTLFASGVTVGGVTYTPSITLKSISDTITNLGDKVEYEVVYTPSTGGVTGDLVITFKDNAGTSFSGSGDVNIYKDGALYVTGQSTDMNSSNMPSGKYTLVANSVTVSGTTYTGVATLKSTSDTITTQGDKVEYEVVYTPSTGGVTGDLVVTLKDGTGASFSGSGDVNIYRDGSLYVTGQSTDFSQTGMTAGKYTLFASAVNVGGKLYLPSSTLKSSSDTITNQGDKVEYEVVYTLYSGITGDLVINVKDNAGNAFTSGDYDILLNGSAIYIQKTSDLSLTGQSAGKYTITARSITVGSTTYTGVATLKSTSDTITTQGDKVEYEVVYTPSSGTVTGLVVVTVKDSAGAKFTSGDYDILRDSTAVATKQTSDYSNATMNKGKYTITARSVTVSGTTYNATATLKSTSDTISSQGDKVEYEIVYSSSSANYADLSADSFALTSTSNAPMAGATVAYEVKYKNLSTSVTATGVTIDIDYDETDGSVVVPTGCTNNSPSTGIMRCTLSDVAASGSGTFTFSYTIKSGLATNTALDHKATLANTNGDSNVSNNSVTVKTLVNGAVTLTKTVSSTTAGDNILLTYTIKVKRNTSSGNTIHYKLTDSFTNTSVITGSNGGKLTYLLNSGTCTGVTCSINDINKGPITVSLDKAGVEAVITYQARTGNANMASNSVSTLTNTVTAVDTATTSPQPTLTASSNVTLSGPSSSGSSSSGGGGGGGGGGGHIMYTGDMKLKIERMISLDGKTYSKASEKDINIAIAENKSTTLYTKVYVTNLGNFSATYIQFVHSFDKGKSDITAGSVTNVVGAIYKGNYFSIDKVKVGEKKEFRYQIDLKEDGENVNPAMDKLKLANYKSSLFSTQDGLKYLGIGNTYSTNLYAGKVPSTVKEDVTEVTAVSKVMSVNVISDKSYAAPGDTVNFTITLKNLTDKDLTDLFVNHNYDSGAFASASALSAANNGTELTWKTSKLEAGKTATYKLSLKVKSGVTAGTIARNLTRVLVNEYANISPVYSSISIVSASTPGKKILLAKTGPAGILALLMVLSALGYLGFESFKNRLYLRGRRIALTEI